MRRRTASVFAAAFVVALAAVTAAGPAAIAASAARAASPATLAVSAPSAPVDATPGHTVHSYLRVLDPGAQSVTVTVANVNLDLGVNGHAQFLTGPDPVFGRDISLTPQSPFTVPAGSYRQVGVSIAVPSALAPGAYLLGFLVTPVVSGPGVRVINQVGAVLDLNVLGVQHPNIAVQLHGASGFVLGSSATVVERTSNLAKGGTIVYGEVTTHASPVGPSLDLRIPPQLLPGGLYRDEVIHLHPTLGIGVFHLTARIVFHVTPARTAEVDVQRTVVVLAAWPLIVLAAVLLGLGIAVVWRRRVRRTTGQAGGHDGAPPPISAGSERTAPPTRPRPRPR